MKGSGDPIGSRMSNAIGGESQPNGSEATRGAYASTITMQGAQTQYGGMLRRKSAASVSAKQSEDSKISSISDENENEKGNSGVEDQTNEDREEPETTPGTSTRTSRSGQIRHNPYAGMSPKGYGQIQRYVEIVYGKKSKIEVRGQIQEESVKIILDRQSNYDTITAGVIAAVKSDGGAIRCRKAESNEISTLLRNEKEIEFDRASCEVKIRRSFL